MSDKCPECGVEGRRPQSAKNFLNVRGPNGKYSHIYGGLTCVQHQLAQRDEQLAAEKLENAKLRAALHDHEAMIEEADKKLAAAKAGLDKALAAAQTLCRIYFDIASEAVGEGEVNRQREKRISAELAKEKP